MELLRKNIHTQQTKARSTLQMPLETDINVSDTKPDVAKIIHSAGRVKVEEVKTGMNKVWVKGRLCYRILYKTAQAESYIDGMEGEVPFSEEIYIEEGEGLSGNDLVVCRGSLEDMNIVLINSRKLSLRSVITLEPNVCELIERQVCTGIDISALEASQGAIEYRHKDINYLETAVQKRDLLRLHEEVRLPAGSGEVGTLLWRGINIGSISFKPVEGRLVVNGELNLFIVYRERDLGKVCWQESVINFNSNVECDSARDGMLADVAYEIGNEEVGIKDNEDGESRIITAEMTINLDIKLYERQCSKVLADVYGVTCKAQANIEKETFKDLALETTFSEKLGGVIKLDESESGFLQVCHCDSTAILSEVKFCDNNITLKGTAQIKLLYTSQREPMATAMATATDTSTEASVVEIFSLSEAIPFEFSREMTEGVENIGEYSLYISISSQSVTIKDLYQAQWQGNITAKLLAYSNREEELLTGLELAELDPNVIEGLPGFAIYYVKPNDSLWQIGKKYYVSIERLKSINNITGDEICAGDRILVVK